MGVDAVLDDRGCDVLPAEGHQDSLAEIQRAVDDGNAAVSAAEAVRRFRVLPAEFSIESGHLTPSLKLKRAVVTRDFASDIDRLYQS